MGAPDRVGRGLGQAEVLHLAGLHQIRHGADRILDRHRGVDAVLVVEVDDVKARALEARVAGLAHVVGPAVDALEAAVRVADVAELGGHHHPFGALAHGAADQLLVAPDAVGVGGVEEIHPEVEGAVDRGERFRVVPPGVEIRHSHAAEAEGEDFEPLGAELARLHGRLRKVGASPSSVPHTAPSRIRRLRNEEPAGSPLIRGAPAPLQRLHPLAS